MNVALLFGIVLGFPAAPLSGDELLESVSAAKTGMENSMCVTEWEDSANGRASAAELLTIHTDSLGRIRVVGDRWKYDDGGNRLPADQPHFDDLYDGEKTVHLRDDPRLDEFGTPPPPGSTNRPSGYTAAQIFNGLWPAGNGPHSYRTPFTIIDGSVLPMLKEAVANSQARITEVRTNEGTSFDVLFPEGKRGPEGWTTLARVDASRGWTIGSVVRRRKDGTVGGQRETIFRESDDGRWLPVSGFIRSWGASATEADPPATEWRFKVLECRVNDPGFDESIFHAALPPGTAVSDLRYDVAYRVGAEKAFDTQLTKLAEEAKGAQGKQQTRPLPEAKGRWGFWIWTFNTVFVIVIVILVVRFTRSRAGR